MGYFFAAAFFAAQRFFVAAIIAALPAALSTRFFLTGFTLLASQPDPWTQPISSAALRQSLYDRRRSFPSFWGLHRQPGYDHHLARGVPHLFVDAPLLCFKALYGGVNYSLR